MKQSTPDVKRLRDYLPLKKETEKRPGAVSTLLNQVGLAVWFGGSLMGILAVNPAVEVLDDPEERGKLVDEAWARFQPYSTLGLLTALVTHVMLRRRGPRKATPTFVTAARLQDAAMVGAVAASVASLALGEYETAALPEDYDPEAAATENSEEFPELPPHKISLTSWALLGSGLMIFVTGAIMAVERNKKR